MTDLMTRILADPELRQWPRYRPPAPESVNDPENDHLEELAPEIEFVDADHAEAAEKLQSLLQETNSDEQLAAPTHRDSVELPLPPHDEHAATNDDRTAPDAHPDTATAHAGAADQPQPDKSTDDGAATLTFDDIASKPNALQSGFGAAGQWVKRQEWKSPRTLAIIAASAIAIVSLVIWVAGSNSTPAAPTAQLTTTNNTGRAASKTSPAAVDTSVTAATATARCPAPSSDPMNAFRPESVQPWICIRAWQIDGQLLQVLFDKTYVLSAASIMPGANTTDGGEDQWNRYRTVRKLTWAFNDAAQTRCDQDTDSQRKTAVLNIGPATCTQKGPWQPVVASSVTITIRKTEAPSNPGSLGAPESVSTASADYTAFAVSRLELIGHPAAG
ncbi:hypothetical protein [Mycobacteroides abscessus]|uniref:hypothetical protein n=1 Tax=Mycobacteroides abscessus TaxID=36809 RepID=UPI0009262B7A|nr:hypothetical protein [Mycobacteroides abscessus]SHY27177.1 F5/8 type C domain-containing protein [Mycobacteroides abscessus subsp. abscessus]SID73115.1 F5/8 type C domain-containing protein [Mycobacteroides abscessus subsp. abscessus]SIK17857.1 F5/8 type C domain-containing protein [Mycobacteroides abscessus subsp. abscessus]SIM42056.1 F5/8 type C domain-containing protein [Mycobacteroides abscessus subsp. abscessus]SKM13794.1 F5/8 type C domain-containing protein [Mycobacteroides abscessus